MKKQRLKKLIITSSCTLLFYGQVQIALLVMILGFVGASGICHADEIAVLPGTGGQTNHAWNGIGSTTGGYQFTVNSPVTVTELGFFVPQGSLADNHQVGIWTSGGTLLVSATVPAATSPTLLDGFDFVPVTPITLGTGSYVIGAEGNTMSTDQFTFGKTGSITISSITLGVSVSAEFGPVNTLTFPTVQPTDFATEGYFGPDFLVAVPEPSTISLACLGVLAWASRLRRSGPP